MISLGKFNTLSNYISLFRLVLSIPVFFLLDGMSETESYRTVLIILLWIAYFSDIADGYFARKFNQVSEWGKVIDPLADKVLVVIIVIKLFLLNEIPSYYFWIIVLRDVLIFTGGIFVSKKLGKVLPSDYVGKITVATIALFIMTVIINIPANHWLYRLLLYASIILSFASVINYGLRALKIIKVEAK